MVFGLFTPNLEKIKKTRNIPKLLGYLHHPKWEVRKGAAQVLADMRAVQAVDILIELLLRDWCAEVRGSAALALGAIQDTRAIAPLIQSLTEVIINIKKNAAQALVQMGEAAIPALTAALSHRDPEVRQQIVWVLGEMGDMQTLKPLLRALRDDHWTVRQAALNALNKLDQQRPACLQEVSIVPHLLAALSKKELRDWAVRLLIRIGRPAVPTLTKFVQDAKQENQPYIAWILGEIRDQEALPGLLAALMSDLEDTVVAAAAALEKLDPNWRLRQEARKFISTLLQALHDPQAERRRQAAKALQFFREPTAIPALLDSLADPEAAVQTAAAAALDAITGKSYGKDLSRWNKWWRVHQGDYSTCNSCP